MSLIIKKIIEKFEVAKTTKDLIYKEKTVDVHDIDGSYKKMVEEGTMLLVPFKYGKQQMYIAKDQETYSNLVNLLAFYQTLAEKKIDLQGMPNNSFKILQNEIFNSLWMEGVRSSKKQLKQFLKNKDDDVEDKLSTLVKNYQLAYNYIATTKIINEENLFALYVILSKDIDLGGEKLDNYPYREEMVNIGDNGKHGIEPNDIKLSLDSMFSFVASRNFDALKSGEEFYNILLFTMIIHYHFELIHPYYDMNGRMGRLVALWFANNSKVANYLLAFSESINCFKHDYYYKAFRDSDINNFKYDVTHFVQSVLFSMTGHTIAELIIIKINEEIKNKYKLKISELQRDILMGIITKENKWYLMEDFVLGMSNINQGQLSKAMTQLVEWNILEETQTKPKEYKFNWKENLKYVEKLINKTFDEAVEKVKESK